MRDILIKADKFVRLLGYIDLIGFNSTEIARRARLNARELLAMPRSTSLPASDYSRLYRETVAEMQQRSTFMPWAAGIGSDVFEMLCHAMIGANTLGEALQRAEKYSKVTFPLNGLKIQLQTSASMAKLSYSIDIDKVDKSFLPEDWSGTATFPTVSRASGLVAWHAFCGWLIGRSIETSNFSISAPAIGSAYEQGLAKVVDCPIEFGAADTVMSFPLETLDFRLVHTPDSLKQFLSNAVYQLILIESKPASTSAAIKSLLGIDFKDGMPAFSELAERLHMSESSLRRRLLKEKTSYRILKDELRCSAATEKLREGNIKINELSDLLGYTEPSSFVRSFRNWTGMTPKMYSDKVKVSAL